MSTTSFPSIFKSCLLKIQNNDLLVWNDKTKIGLVLRAFMWKQLASKEIFSHPRLTLLEDDVLLPNGHQTKYLRYKDDGGAVVTIIYKRPDGKILLQKEYAYPINEVLFQLPGGGVAPNETPEQGANRELMEEVGLKANKLQLLGNYLFDNRRSAKKCYLFLASDITQEKLQADAEEDIEQVWLSEKEIQQMIMSGEIINIHTLACWSIYQSQKDSISNNV